VPATRTRLTTASSASGATGSSASPDLRPRPWEEVFASPDPRARPQPWPQEKSPPRPTPGLGLGRWSLPRPTPGLNLGLGRNRVLTRPRPQPQEKSSPRPTLGSDRSRHGGYIITLPIASSGYGEQDWCPIWLAPVTSNDGSPRVPMTTVVLSPLRKQGDVSKIPAAPTAVLLQGSSTSPTATLSPTQGSSTSSTAMLAYTQSSSTSLPDTLAPSYTPHCTPVPSPCIYKREVQGLQEGGSRGRTS
jgi:hypothetical protein